MKNGTTRVISSEGIELKGQARTDAIKASEDLVQMFRSVERKAEVLVT
jgi:hypothetical protein